MRFAIRRLLFATHWILERFHDSFHSPFDRLLCGCQPQIELRALFLMPVALYQLHQEQRARGDECFSSRPKRDLLLCVARHRAVTLAWNAPLSKAQGPGISVSKSNRQEFVSPGSACRRVVPWGRVSSWVKGAD